MFIWSSPLWLLALAVLPLIWWLHRFQAQSTAIPVSSLLYWKSSEADAKALKRGAKTDPLWLLRALIASLLIFSAFLLFVVIVSYISYKAKSGDRVPPHLRNHIDPLGNGLVLQPATVSNSIVVRQAAPKYLAPVQSIIESQKAGELKRKEDNYTKAVQTIQQLTNKTKIYRAAQEKNEDWRKDESRKVTRYRSTLQSSRLEIMNQSEKFRTSVQDEYRSVRRENAYTNHGDLNIIAYYSDRSDADYTSFSVPRISRAM